MTELVAPAGSTEALNAAIAEGADAVYVGLKEHNARLNCTNFTWNELEAAVQAVHRLHKKIYVALNTVIEERETESLYRILCDLDRIGADALIVQDTGLIRMAREFFPRLRLHASPRIGAASAHGVNMLSRSGISRVILARELSIQEISRISQSSSAELEIFVHGEFCISEAGLCLFSSFLGGKSANRGMCTQACRRLFHTEDSSSHISGYYFSPHDLQTVDLVPAFIQAGVRALTIEGRTKSADYVGSTTAAYRHLLDNWEKDSKAARAAAKRMLASDFSRAKTHYWYDFQGEAAGSAGTEVLAYKTLKPDQAAGTGIYLGQIERLKTEAGLTLAAMGANAYEPDTGDSIRIHKKDGSFRQGHKIRSVIDSDGSRWIDIPKGFSTGDHIYLSQTKQFSKKYRRLLPPKLKSFKRSAGKLPPLTKLQQKELNYFPSGLYVQVSTLSDLSLVLAAKPVRIILELNSETERDLIEKQIPLPVSKKQIIISLDPFCPQAVEEHLTVLLPRLRDAGFSVFIANTPAHISLLRHLQAEIIAGPYLYTFNRWAVSWLSQQGMSACITPLENSRRNLEATFNKTERSQVMVTVFAYPALFRMRFALPESYDFAYFSDKNGTLFKSLSTPNGSFVLPYNPFSILDKASHIKSEGFSRFLLDLSKTRVQKNHLKQILSALHRQEPLPETVRFNWKEGFYTEHKRLSQTEKQGGRRPSERSGFSRRKRKAKGNQSAR